MSLEIVKRVREKLVSGPDGENTIKGPCGAFKVVVGVVETLRAQGDKDAGYILKIPPQNNCQGRGTDIVMWPSGRIVDILGDGGNTNTPIFQERPWVDPGLYRADSGTSDSGGGSGQPGEAGVWNPEETVEALKRLNAFYKAPEGLQRPEGLWISGGPDFLGIGVWLTVYFNERARGKSPEQAAEEVAQQIRSSDEWRAKHR